MDALLEAVKLLKPAAVIDGKAQLTALINRGRWQRYLKGMKSRKKYDQDHPYLSSIGSTQDEEIWSNFALQSIQI